MSMKAAENRALQGAHKMVAIGLQNRCTTTVLSRQKRAIPSVSAISGQRRKREKRTGQRFVVAQLMAQSVHPLFREIIGPMERGNAHTGPGQTNKERSHG